MTKQDPVITATRQSLQWGRRIFHFSMGIIVGVIYQFGLTHDEAIHILGLTACLFYIFDQIRVKYPEFSSPLNPIIQHVLRAEEQLKESSSIPYVMGILLTLISFPQVIALVGIYTLAISDPMAAIIGIKYGKTKISNNKSLQGSLAFFLSTFCIALSILYWHSGSTALSTEVIFLTSFLIALCVSLFELIPIRLDDNLTIPIFTSTTLWILFKILNLST